MMLGDRPCRFLREVLGKNLVVSSQVAWDSGYVYVLYAMHTFGSCGYIEIP